jgi:hypothetical protein
MNAYGTEQKLKRVLTKTNAYGKKTGFYGPN